MGFVAFAVGGPCEIDLLELSVGDSIGNAVNGWMLCGNDEQLAARNVERGDETCGGIR
jgi:hypothetical protein